MSKDAKNQKHKEALIHISWFIEGQIHIYQLYIDDIELGRMSPSKNDLIKILDNLYKRWDEVRSEISKL